MKLVVDNCGKKGYNRDRKGKGAMTVEEEIYEEVYTLVDEEGKEQDFAVLATCELDGKAYYAMVPNDEESEVYVILRADVDENGETTLTTIDDDAEFDRAADVLNDLLFDTADYDAE